MKVEITITDCPNKKELLKHLKRIVDYFEGDNDISKYFPDNGKEAAQWCNNTGDIVGKSDTKITYPDDNAKRNYLINNAKNAFEDVLANDLNDSRELLKMLK